MNVTRRVEIIFDESLEKQMLMLVRQCGIQHYTRLDNVKGVGESGAKFNNPIGPGINSMLVLFLSQPQVEVLVRGFRKFKHVAGGHSSAKMVISPLEEFI